MKKIMFVGSVGVGKTTLKQRLRAEEIKYHKTMVIDFFDDIVDTPGEYLDNRLYLKALIQTSFEVDTVIFCVDALNHRQSFSPNMISAFNRECIGVITKTDLATETQIAVAREQLELAGATKIFKLGLTIKDELEDLINLLTME